MLHDALRRDEADADSALRLPDHFVCIASHETRTPLAALKLSLAALQRAVERTELPEGSPVPRRLDRVQESANRLERILCEMLEVSRLTTGPLRLEPEPLDVAAVVRAVVGRAEPEARLAGCDLRCAASAPLPARLDRMRVEQVVAALLSNATKYGAGHPVEVEVYRRGAEAVIDVRDQGIGIDVAHQDRIFSRFERAVAEHEYGGLGVGLWLARRIVEACGGSIGVESARGVGSRFTVTLPLATT